VLRHVLCNAASKLSLIDFSLPRGDSPLGIHARHRDCVLCLSACWLALAVSGARAPWFRCGRFSLADRRRGRKVQSDLPPPWVAARGIRGLRSSASAARDAPPPTAVCLHSLHVRLRPSCGVAGLALLNLSVTSGRRSTAVLPTSLLLSDIGVHPVRQCYRSDCCLGFAAVRMSRRHAATAELSSGSSRLPRRCSRSPPRRSWRRVALDRADLPLTGCSGNARLLTSPSAPPVARAPVALRAEDGHAHCVRTRRRA